MIENTQVRRSGVAADVDEISDSRKATMIDLVSRVTRSVASEVESGYARSKFTTLREMSKVFISFGQVFSSFVNV